jgi:phosphate transport system substrate-binding protein
LTGAAIAVVACGGQEAPVPVQAPTATAASAAAPAGAAPTPTAAAAAPAANGSALLINGAGSSFDNPLFSKAFGEYTKAHPTVQINYQSVGSGAGIQQLTKGTVDFGATDAPMDDKQISDAGGDIVHIPVTLGAASIAYNLPNVAEGLKLTGAVLADIFLGKITAWNDPALMKLNPDAKLDNTPIAVVHRSDGSGTSDIFTTFLSQTSPDWKSKVGNGTSVNWPVGIGGKGSEGVAGQVKQTVGGIGYFELAYAKQNKLTSAAIDDGTGNFALPSSDGASTCAASVASYPADLRQRIAGCSGKGVYPISGLSWIVLHKELKDSAKGAAMVDLLWWLVHDGQSFGKDLFYAPLADNLVKADEEKLRGITSGGKPLKTG